MDAPLHLDLTGLLRTGAIIVGLVLTTIGCLAGIIAQRGALHKEANTIANSSLRSFTASK